MQRQPQKEIPVPGQPIGEPLWRNSFEGKMEKCMVQAAFTARAGVFGYVSCGDSAGYSYIKYFVKGVMVGAVKG